jgi:hypothetical protein
MSSGTLKTARERGKLALLEHSCAQSNADNTTAEDRSNNRQV